MKNQIPTIEEKEESIFLLNKIDNNFALIKEELKNMKSKIKKIHLSMEKVNSDCKHWINFFSNEGDLEEGFVEGDLEEGLKNGLTGEYQVKNTNSCSNPFEDISETTKSFSSGFENNDEYLNNNGIDNLKGISNLNEDIGRVEQSQINNEKEDLFPTFNDSQLINLPTIFKDENILFELFEFIKLKKVVNLEEVSQRFIKIPSERLEIFIKFLLGRNHISIENNKLKYFK